MGKRKFLFIVFLLVVIVTAACFFVYNAKGEVLGISEEIKFVSPEASEGFNPPTPTPTVTPSPTPTSTSVPTKIPSPTAVTTKTPTPTPSPKIVSATSAEINKFDSKEINGFIDRFSSQYGVDPNVIRYLALCESGFNSGAVNGIYAGLFQFNPVSWKNVRVEMGEDPDPNLRFSAEESVQTTTYCVSMGKRGLWPNCFPK